MKLLTFKDYGDEHDVSALACFTEEEFVKWCDSAIGKPNLNYEQELADYRSNQEKWQVFVKEMQERGLYAKDARNFTAEETRWYNANKVEYVSSRDCPEKGKSFLHAYLGNNSEGFSEGYNDYLTGQDLIDAGIVKVTPVTKAFYDTFHRADLSSLSLCNVFEIESEEEDKD